MEVSQSEVSSGAAGDAGDAGATPEKERVTSALATLNELLPSAASVEKPNAYWLAAANPVGGTPGK